MLWCQRVRCSSLRQVHPLVAGVSEMAFGFMNTRRYALLYSFLASLFMNCVSVYWTMWSVLTISLFMLTLTDFMFFQVRRACCAHWVWVVVGGEGGVHLLSQAASLRCASCRAPLLPAAPRPTMAHLPALSLPLALGLAGWLPPSVLDLARTRTRRRAVLPSQDNEFW